MNQTFENDLKAFNQLYHKLIFITQQKNEDLFSNPLKNFTTIEISIINYVYQYPKITVKKLLEILKVPNSTLTNAINRLEKKKLLSRIINEEDKRSYRLQLTQQGEQVQIKHIESEEILFNMILSPLTNEERQLFIECFKKIITTLQER